MSCVALGFFDGVHIGHRELIKKAVALSREKNEKALVYTFSLHPSYLLTPERKAKLIYPSSIKEKLLLSLGAHEVIFDDFSRVRNMTPSEFVERILIGELSATSVVCGYNFRFGKGNSGDIDTLANLLSPYGVRLSVIPPVCAEDEPVSSGRIRALLENGEIEKANLFLSSRYVISGAVVSGKHLGHSLGFPTANVEQSPDFVYLKRGVYYTKTKRLGKEYYSVTNVGVRPTVNDGKTVPVIETHLIGFEGELYTDVVDISFFSYAREEKHFNSFDELSRALENDVKNCLEYFKMEEEK